MVLNKIADGKIDLKDEGQKPFIEMLRKHNYDINKIIDEHVQKINEMMIKRRRIEADFPGFLEILVPQAHLAVARAP